MFILAWLVVVVVCCVSYLYSGQHMSLLENPNELGDFLSGVAAVVSLPSILFVLLDSKRTQQERAKQEAEANSLRQFQAFMTIHQALSKDFQSYLKGIVYYLESSFPAPKRTKLSKFHAPDDVVAYLRAVHFGKGTIYDTLQEVRRNKGLNYVAREFCTQIDTFIQFAKNTHYLDDNALELILETHPSYEVYQKLCDGIGFKSKSSNNT